MALVGAETERFARRRETRYLLEEGCVPRIRDLLKRGGFSLDSHSNPITQTVYLASPSLAAVPEGYLRIRRYVPKAQAAQDVIILFPYDLWFVEVKLPAGDKERMQMGYDEIESLLDPANRQSLAEQFPIGATILQGFNDKLVPIVATQWLRQHYINAQHESRITLDHDMRYYGFSPGQLRGVLIGSKSGFKLEIKTPIGSENEVSPIIQETLGLCQTEPLSEGWHEDLLRKLYSDFLKIGE